MPRATIPYERLQKLAETKYPEPLFMDVYVLKPDRILKTKTPTRVYDRSTGNFAPIGWKVQIEMRQFDGIEETYRGYETKYKRRMITDILFD
jgi:hypothetical protein